MRYEQSYLGVPLGESLVAPREKIRTKNRSKDYTSLRLGRVLPFKGGGESYAHGVPSLDVYRVVYAFGHGFRSVFE